MKINRPTSTETRNLSSEFDELEAALKSLDESLSALEKKTVEERSDPYKISVVDMTDLIGLPGKTTRVVMRRTRVPSGYSGNTEKINPERRILGEHYAVGLIADGELPREGEVFEINQILFDGHSDYTPLRTSSPIGGLKIVGNRYYFHSFEAPTADSDKETKIEWCVELDSGN